MIPPGWTKKPHRKGCTGNLVRRYGDATVHTDMTGRVGNGGIIAYEYHCIAAYEGCPARVLVTEAGIRRTLVATFEARA